MPIAVAPDEARHHHAHADGSQRRPRLRRQNGFGGFWASQILPFGDPTSFIGYMNFETAFYQSLKQRMAS
jgi:hypothetical protein